MSNTTTNQNWRDVTAIAAELESSPDIGSIRMAASLRAFLIGSLFSPDYKADVRWSDLVKLTPSGELAFEMIEKRLAPDTSKADLAMGLFCLLSHHELLIDCLNSDLKGILALLQSDLVSQRLRLPHRFGRLL
jgi:hypothetical protein